MTVMTMIIHLLPAAAVAAAVAVNLNTSVQSEHIDTHKLNDYNSIHLASGLAEVYIIELMSLSTGDYMST